MSATAHPARPLIRLWTAPSGPAASRQPLSYSIDDALGVVFIDLLSIDDPAAVVQALQQVRLDRSFRHDLNVCIDCAGLRVPPSAEDVRAIAKLFPRAATRGLTGRLAIVTSPSWTYGGPQTFAVLARGRFDRVHVFEHVSYALLWLGAGR